MRSFARGLLFVAAVCCAPAFPQCQQSNCVDGTHSANAKYRVCLPELSCWNGNLVVFAHGYVDPFQPIAIPESQLVVGGLSLPKLMNQLGYAFAVSSYSKNGLAITQGVEDLKDLVENVVKPPNFPAPNRVYLTGASEGGLVTALSAEQLPNVYNAALAACGPVGSFQKQIDYFGDFRVVFDYFFPGVLPASPVDIPDEVIQDWYTKYVPAIGVALANNPGAAAQLIRVMRAPVTSDPLTVGETVVGALWYNIFATNDAIATLGGQPFDNHDRIYRGSANDLLLNAHVQRFSADPAARSAVAMHYETSGRLMMPAVTIHTTGDPIIPYWQEPLYTTKTLLAGTFLRRTNLPFAEYGHCSFTAGQILAGFGIMVLRDSGSMLLSSLEHALTGQVRKEYREALRKAGKY